MAAVVRYVQRKPPFKGPVNGEWVYTTTYLLMLFIVSIPSKFIFYVAAPVTWIMLVILGLFYKNLVRIEVLLFTMALAIIGASSLLLEPHVAILPALLWAVTYSAFLLILFFFLFPPAIRISHRAIRRLAQVATYWVLLQGIVGIVQFILSGNSDAVAGTVGLLDFKGNITINQVYFGFAILSLIPVIAFCPCKLRLRWLSLLFGIVAVALSQSGHATFAFLIAGILVYGLFAKNLIWALRSFAIAVLISFSVLFFYPNTLPWALGWAGKLIAPNSPKLLIIRRLLADYTADVKLLILGAGPGQYISKAALVGSGLLTRVKLPFQEPPLRLREVEWIFDVYRNVGEGSAIAKPYNSFISIFAEWGFFLGTLLAGTWAFLISSSLLSSWRASIGCMLGKEWLFFKRYSAFYLTFLGLSAMVELYFEMPAAIIPGGWFLVVFSARALYVRNDMNDLTECNRDGICVGP